MLVFLVVSSKGLFVVFRLQVACEVSLGADYFLRAQTTLVVTFESQLLVALLYDVIPGHAGVLSFVQGWLNVAIFSVEFIDCSCRECLLNALEHLLLIGFLYQ